MKPGAAPLRSVRLMDQVRERIRCLHYSLGTEKTTAIESAFHPLAGKGRSNAASAQQRACGGIEGLRLRIKDGDFDRHVIIIREAKGHKDRIA